MRLWPRKQVYVDDLPRTHDLRFAAVFVLVFAALLAAVYALGFFVAGDRLPRGTTVAGVDVGGMKRPEARTELQSAFAPRLEEPLKARALDQTFELDPQRSGLTFDIEATLSEGLSGERWDPRHMLKVVMGGEELPAIVDVDDSELEAALDKVAKDVDRDPVDATVTFNHGSPVASEGVVGTSLDYEGSRDALVAALLAGDGDEVVLPVESLDPAITTGDAAEFVKQVAEPALDGPVRVRVADATRVVPVPVFAPAFHADIVDGELRLGINAEVLAARSRSILASLPHHPVNARITFAAGHTVVVPGRSGTRVLPDDWAAAVLAATAKAGDHRVASAKVTPNPPDFTTAEARQLKVTERIAAASLRVPETLGADVRSLVDRVDGALVRPGATFDLAARLGQGASDAATLVASGVYDAAFHAGLGDLERTAPPTHVPSAAAGLDALGPALSWRNGSPYGVYTRVTLEPTRQGGGELTVSLWSTRFWKVTVSSSGRYDIQRRAVERRSGRGCSPRQGSDGFSIDVNRTFAADGSAQRAETVHSVYIPVSRVICRR